MWRKLFGRKISSLRYAKQIRTIFSIVLNILGIFVVYWISGAALSITHQNPSREWLFFNYGIILYPILTLICYFPFISNLIRKYPRVWGICGTFFTIVIIMPIELTYQPPDNFQTVLPLISPALYSSLYIERVEMIVHSNPDTKRRPIY